MHPDLLKYYNKYFEEISLIEISLFSDAYFGRPRNHIVVGHFRLAYKTGVGVYVYTFIDDMPNHETHVLNCKFYSEEDALRLIKLKAFI